jgi:hypothetical protein
MRNFNQYQPHSKRHSNRDGQGDTADAKWIDGLLHGQADDMANPAQYETGAQDHKPATASAHDFQQGEACDENGGILGQVAMTPDRQKRFLITAIADRLAGAAARENDAERQRPFA